MIIHLRQASVRPLLQSVLVSTVVLGLPSFLLGASQAWAVPPANGATLEDIYRQSIDKTESNAIQESLIGQANERVSQARGGILPNLSLVGAYTRQDSSNSDGGGSTSSQLRDPNQYTVKATLVQPLFRGLREFAALRSAEGQVRVQQALTEQNKLTLFSSVSQAYYNVLAAEKDLENLAVLLDLSKKRVNELRAQTRIGRSRVGDLYSAEAQVAAVDAQMDAARQAVEQARDTFAYVTGLDRRTPLRDDQPLLKGLPPIDTYLSKVDARPDLIAQKEAVMVSEEGVTIAKGAHLPSLDFTGNYYFKRSGVLDGNKWDLGLNLVIPIYTGGVTSSLIREASLREQQTQLTLSQARRGAERDVQLAYQALYGTLQQNTALNVSAGAAEKSYNAQQRDYRNGLVNNLEVIQSLNAYVDSMRARDRSVFQVKAALASLKAATGEVVK